jgi:hypothetical protein
LLLSALSGPCDRVEIIEDHQDLPTIFTFLRTGELHDILITRLLKKRLNANEVVESAVVTAWLEMANDTLGYLGDFKEVWQFLGSFPKELCDSVSISFDEISQFKLRASLSTNFAVF